MRLTARDVAVALGSFLIVSAVLTHVLAAARFAQTVPSVDSRTRSVATDATVLDSTTGRLETGLRLDRRRSVALAEPPAPGLDAYVVSASVQKADETFVTRQRWSAVQQPASGRAIASPFNTEQITRFDANGNTVEKRRPLRTLRGVVLRFARGTEPVDQLRWDPFTGTAGTAEFVRRASISGHGVLEFRQRGTGRTGGTFGDVAARSDTTLWVRPETGAVVKERAHVINRLPDGQVALDATFVDVAADVRAASGRVDDAVQRRTFTAVVTPSAISILGVLALVTAGFEGSSGRVTRRWRSGPHVKGA